MRPTPGALPAVLARRWAATDRLVTLTLPRDRFSAVPGPTLDLWLGERTQYRNAAWIMDDFERPNASPLPEPYAVWTAQPGFGDLALVGGQVVPAAVGVTVERFMVYQRLLEERAQWAELTIGELASPDVGGYASVGVVLRASAPGESGDAYLIVAVRSAAVGRTRIGRLAGGVVTWLADELTPWRPGERLRGEIDGARLRVYRQDVRILETVDPNPLLVSGRIGIEAVRTLANDQAAIAEWMGGPRQEYVGAAIDVGDVSASLGLLDPATEPAKWDMTLSNLQPLGGAARFAELIRHGRRNDGAYDVVGAPVRILTAYQGASAPLAIASGQIEGIDGLEETRVRLRCAGPDANLDPRIEGKEVTYLASPCPFGGPPVLPPDPCAPSPLPVVDPGTEPDEEDADPDDGQGPEQPPDDVLPPGALPTPLLGEWVVDHGWSGFDDTQPGSPIFIVTPVVTQYVQPDETPSFSKYEGLPLQIVTMLERPEPPPPPEVHDYVGYRCFAPFPTGACDPGATGLPNNHFFAILDDAINLDNYPISVPPPHPNPLECHRCSRVTLLFDKEELPPPWVATGKWF